MSADPVKPLSFLPEELIIPEADPFKNDVFERKGLAENLTRLAATFTNQPFVLAVNGSWGSGKTKFLEMWRCHLQAQGFNTLLFNAWESDHSDDPFAAILSEFRRLVEQQKGDQRKKTEQIWSKVAKKSLPILERAAAGVVKNLTLGILDLKSSDAEALISDLAEESAKHALERCVSNRESIEAFRNELQSLVQSEQNAGKPIVYIIDELDRCRPIFALSVLERIKHLLNVPGVVFVFAWDRLQLNNTIRAIYGGAADPGGYLARFVDLELNLPKGDSVAFCKSLMRRFGLVGHLYANSSHESVQVICEVFPRYAVLLALTVREQEKAFIALAISCRINPYCREEDLEIFVCLVAIRLKKTEVYAAICNVNNTYDQLVQKDLPELFGREYWNSKRGAYIQGCLLCGLEPSQSESIVKDLMDLANSQPRSESRDRFVFDGYLHAQRGNRDRGGLLKRVIEQMEFIDAFWS